MKLADALHSTYEGYVKALPADGRWTTRVIAAPISYEGDKSPNYRYWEKRLGGNTSVWFCPEYFSYCVELYRTPLAVFFPKSVTQVAYPPISRFREGVTLPKGVNVFYTLGGSTTQTTRSRLKMVGFPVRIKQGKPYYGDTNIELDRGEWYYVKGGKPHAFGS
jgi:hypothetical protein